MIENEVDKDASPGVSGRMRQMVKSVRKYLPRHARSDVERCYKFGRELGTGNFAVVKQAIKKDTGEQYAVKIINKSLCSGKEDMIETEIAILKRVRHPHIVGMLEEFDTPDRLYLVLDYVDGGELFDRIVEMGNFTEMDASRITKQMTLGIQYLHECGIVHRDLKPENLLFKHKHSQDHILITDFGLAKLINDEEALKTACGTPNYVAPEILMQRGYGKEVDVWSMGVIVFILLCGYPPFYDESDAKLFEMIMKGKFEFDERYWRDVSQGAKNLISNMLKTSPMQRYDTTQILAHPWITGKAKVPSVNLSKSISMNLQKTFPSRNSTNDATAKTATTSTTTTTSASSSTRKRPTANNPTIKVSGKEDWEPTTV